MYEPITIDYILDEIDATFSGERVEFAALRDRYTYLRGWLRGVRDCARLDHSQYEIVRSYMHHKYVEIVLVNVGLEPLWKQKQQ